MRLVRVQISARTVRHQLLERHRRPEREQQEAKARAAIAGASDEELENALHDRRQELFNLRFQSATGALENSARLKLAKREIARILTVRVEREAKAGQI